MDIQRIFENLSCNKITIKKEDLERFSKQKDLLFRTAFLKEIDGKLNELPNKEMSITSFREFISNRYIELKKEYKKLDRNEDGKVSEQELKCSLEQVGIFVKSEEIRKFMKFIDIDNSGYLEFEKFFQFSITLNSYKIDNIFNCYQHLSPQPDPKAGYVFETTAEKNLLNTRYLIAGGIAGAMSKTFTAPLDRFRVLFQVNQKASHFNDVFRKIISENGIFGFWRGNAINVTKIIPESAVRFHVFEKTKFYFVKSNSGITMGQTFVAGGLAGLVSQTVIYPMETLKTRLMAELGQGKSASAYEIARNMYRQGGFQSFYRGLGISILGIVPYAGIDLSIYDKLKKIYIKHSNNNPSALTHMMCGAVSGGVAASIVYPLGLLRTRLQGTDVYNLAQGTSTHPYLYPGGVRDVISETFKKEGIQGFYRGLVPSLAKVIPSVSITYICYEEAKKQLNII